MILDLPDKAFNDLLPFLTNVVTVRFRGTLYYLAEKKETWRQRMVKTVKPYLPVHMNVPTESVGASVKTQSKNAGINESG